MTPSSTPAEAVDAAVNSAGWWLKRRGQHPNGTREPWYDISQDDVQSLAALARTPEQPARAEADDEEQKEQRIQDEDAASNLRLIDHISDRIGQPHDEELTVEAFDRQWAARRSPADGAGRAGWAEDAIEEAIRQTPTKGTTYAPRYSTFGRALSKTAIQMLAKHIARARRGETTGRVDGAE